MNTDIELISEAYRTKILNEAPPPFADGDESFGSSAEKKYGVEDPDNNFKAFTKYPSATKDIQNREDLPDVLKVIVNQIGKQIVQTIADEGGRIEDSKQEAGIRAGELIFQKYPFFRKSHTKHLGRNVIDALLRAGLIKEVDRGTGSGSRQRSTAGLDFDFSTDMDS